MDEGHTEVKAKAITLVDPKTLKFYSRNTNKHTPEQIERLAKLIKHHGMRDPLTVWPETGEVITGNGTLEACLKLQMAEVPVVYQDFKDADEAYTFSVSHNAIQEWSDLDLSQINVDIQDLGPIDIELLGLRDFLVEPAERFQEKELWTDPFDGPSDAFKIIITFYSEEKMKEFISRRGLDESLSFRAMSGGKLRIATFRD